MTPHGTQPALRIGVMCRGIRLPAWQAQTLERLLALPGVALELRIQPPADGVQPPQGATDRVARLARSETTLWDAFNNGYVARRSRSLLQ